MTAVIAWFALAAAIVAVVQSLRVAEMRHERDQALALYEAERDRRVEDWWARQPIEGDGSPVDPWISVEDARKRGLL